MLTLLIVLPLLGAALLLRRPGQDRAAIRVETLLWTGLIALFGLFIALTYRPDAHALTFAHEVNFVLVPALGIHYHLGVDGISSLLVMLTTVLTFIAVLSSTTSINQNVKGFHLALLVLEAALIGVFSSLDLFLFVVFFELVLVPMFFLILIWGGARREYAAIKFVLYTLVGSLPMLIGVLWVAARSAGDGQAMTFDLIQLYGRAIPPEAQLWPFIAFALAFAIKVPLVPLHTWLPDAHVEAPTAGSILLAGVLLKMGTYGFLRIAIPLFPAAATAFAPLIITLAVIGIVYGALVALVQTDVKKLVAYSSVSHLGFVMLGFFSFTMIGLQGGMIQQINHGITSGALFLLVGMIYERRHSREIRDFGGLWTQMPVYARLALITVLASAGLPGLCGFTGEFMTLLGAAQRSLWLAFWAGLGVILAAGYLLWMYERVFYGEPRSTAVSTMPDLSRRELWCIGPLVVLMFWFGLFPVSRYLENAEPDVRFVHQRVLGVSPELAELEQTQADDVHLRPAVVHRAQPEQGGAAAH